MASRRSIYKDNNFYQRVILSSLTRLLEDLDSNSIIHLFLERDFIPYTEVRDLQEHRLSSERIKIILDKVVSRGRKGYREFKKFLIESQQENLAEFLDDKEAELVKEIRMAEKKQEQVIPARTLPTVLKGRHRKPDDKELQDISDHIGFNWEMLGPYLGVPTTKVDQINMDNKTSHMKIFKLLHFWRETNSSNATIENLLSKMKQVPQSVNISWEAVEETVSRYDVQASNASVNLDPEGPYQSGSLPPEGAISQNFSSLQSIPAPSPLHNPPSGHATLPRAEGDIFNGAFGGVEGNQESIHSSLFPDAFADTRKQGQYESNIPAVDMSNSMSSSASAVARSSSGNDMLTDSRPFEDKKTEDAIHRSSEEVKGNNQQQPASYDTTNPLVERLKNVQVEEDTNQSRSYTVVRQIPTVSNQKDETDSKSNPSAMSPSAQPFEREKPNIKPPPAPKDGRLLTPNVEFFKDLIEKSDTKTDKGGFGVVFFYKRKSPVLEIPVVVKRIKCKDDPKHKMMSITNEKLASRTMHFAIVPLLAMTKDPQENTFYFLTPYLQNGDLDEAIKQDTEKLEAGNTVMLGRVDRVRIIFQINSGLQFLHSPITGFRGTIVHTDIRTMNIVLDCMLNARIIDFGLAREMKEKDKDIPVTATEVPGAKGYIQTVNFAKLTPEEDYHNFGVVIRELLTGKPAYDKNKPDEELRKQDKESISDDIQNIWYSNSQIKPSKEAEALNDIADKCLKKEACSNETGNNLKILCEDFMRDNIVEKWVRGKASEDDVKCEMCMVNPAVQIPNVVYGHDQGCRCHMLICISCIRNSSFNPMICHSCGLNLQSIIGHGWGAVIIAGNDIEPGNQRASIFSKDITDINEVIISKWPLVMGISKENTKVVQPTKPGESEDMLVKVKRAFDELQGKGDIHTLFMYFSGHHFPDKGFMLGNDKEFLTVDALKEQMKKFSESYTAKKVRSEFISRSRFMVFLDCCKGPGVNLPNLKDTKDYSILQINSCRRSQSAITNEIVGSIFTKFFIQALTSRAFKSKCINNDCKDCNCLLEGEFVTAEELFQYIHRHMTVYSKQTCQETVQQPVKSEQNTLWHDLLIAYNINFLVEREFKLEDNEKKHTVHKQIYADMQSLRQHLFEKLIEKTKPGQQFDFGQYSDFAESLCIEIDLGPHETEELDSIEKVMGAWNSKRELSVSFRKILNIHRGMVWIDTPVCEIQNKVEQNKPDMERKRTFTKMSLSFTHVNGMIQDVKYAEGEVQTLKSCLQKIQQGINNAKNVCKGENTKVHFIFPNSLSDFMCFQVTGLEKKGTV